MVEAVNFAEGQLQEIESKMEEFKEQIPEEEVPFFWFWYSEIIFYLRYKFTFLFFEIFNFWMFFYVICIFAVAGNSVNC